MPKPLDTRLFQIGDKIRILQWDEMKAFYGEDHHYDAIDIPHMFTKSMRFLCGQRAKIKNVIEYMDNIQKLTLDLNTRGYTINNYMVQYIGNNIYDKKSEELFNSLF